MATRAASSIGEVSGLVASKDASRTPPAHHECPDDTMGGLHAQGEA